MISYDNLLVFIDGLKKKCQDLLGDTLEEASKFYYQLENPQTKKRR